MVKKNSYSGFTLIELALAIIITGIVAAAVLTGKNVIESAKITSTVAGLTNYKDSYNQFYQKYNAIPGDMVDAVNVFTGDYPDNGNGNFKIDSSENSEEHLLFWQHLALAGFIDGKYNATEGGNYPRSKVNVPSGPHSLGVFDAGYVEMLAPESQYSNNNMIMYGKADVAHSTFATGGILTSADAHAVDRKMDDNDATGGLVVATTGSDSNSECNYVDSTNKNLSCIIGYSVSRDAILLANISPSAGYECEGELYVMGLDGKCHKDTTETICPIGQISDGKGGCQDEVGPTCEEGYGLQDGKCVMTVTKTKCAPGYVVEKGACKPFKCPAGYFKANGQCVLKPTCAKGWKSDVEGICRKLPTCPKGYTGNVAGACVITCPQNWVRMFAEDGTQHCEAPKTCPEGTKRNGKNICVNLCKKDFEWDNGTCTKTKEIVKCPVGYTLENGQCINQKGEATCPEDYELKDDMCTKTTTETRDPVLDENCQNQLKNLLNSFGVETGNLDTWDDIVQAYSDIGIDVDQFIQIRQIEACMAAPAP